MSILRTWVGKSLLACASGPISRGSVSLLFALIKDELREPVGAEGDSPIAQERIEDAGEATGERDHGHLSPPARGNAQGPGSQFLRLRRAAAEDRDGGLN